MINVSLYGVVGLESGSRHFESEARTLAELKKSIPGVAPKDANNLICLVNKDTVGRHYTFRDGDEVIFFSPVGGG